MSEVYCLEPPCRGRVILHTTEGELDVRLWSSQCPRAVRNFVQLCLEGYYNNCIFHRIIPQFMVQTGDPSGSGHGGESVYGEPFENEIMSRLKFRYRGLVGMANTGGKCSNGSQFFITLERADCLNGKYTLFGKVDGPTVYNLMKIGQAEVNPADDRPLHPPKITNVEVVVNPFPDIQPRLLALSEPSDDEQETQVPAKEALTVKKKCLLSFGDNSDSDEGGSVANRPVKTQLKSAHDLLNDPKLSKKAVELAAEEFPDPPLPPTPSESDYDPEEDGGADSEDDAAEKDDSDRQREIASLQMQLRDRDRDRKRGPGPPVVEGYDSGNYLTRKQMKKAGKKENVMDRFSAFTKRLSKLSKNVTLAAKESHDTDEELADGSWFAGHQLQFSVDSVKAYEVDAAKDALEVFDPLQGKDNRLEVLSSLKKDRLKGHNGGAGRPAGKW